MSLTALGFLIVTVAFFSGFIVFSIINYQKRFKFKYSLWNHFPYELNFRMTFRDNFYGNICLLLSSVSMIFFAVFYHPQFNNGFFIFGMIDLIFLSIVVDIAVLVPLDYLKAHLINDVLLFTFSLLLHGCVLVGAVFLNQENRRILYTVMIILSVITFGILFLLLMNPKLLHWTEMEKEPDKDGTMKVVRPKRFVLAYTEWGLMFSYIVGAILLFILTF